MDETQGPDQDAHHPLHPGPVEHQLQDDLEGDTLREECGVFGIFGHPSAAAITALGLHALQHRGQEAAGIVSFDGTRFHSERRLGLVGDTFSRREVIERLPGAAAVGHVRYSTTGATITAISPTA
jgi:amidophosphoribosyltransferase